MSANRDAINYGPVPPTSATCPSFATSTMNQYNNLINGGGLPTAAAANQQQINPNQMPQIQKPNFNQQNPQLQQQQPQQQQQQQQQQHLMTPMMMQQQNAALNNAYFNNNINKFMPPQASSTPSASPNPMQQQQPQQQQQQQHQQQLLPPNSLANGTNAGGSNNRLPGPAAAMATSPSAPTTTATSMMTNPANSSSIPAHLRPPGMHPYAPAPTQPHLNGNVSTNSARNISPGLQTTAPTSVPALAPVVPNQGFQQFPTPNQQQQQQMQARSIPNNNNNNNNNNIINNQSNMTGLTNSMQNLNMNYTNGPAKNATITPPSALNLPPTQQQQQQYQQHQQEQKQQDLFKSSAPDILPTGLTPLNANVNPIYTSPIPAAASAALASSVTSPPNIGTSSFPPTMPNYPSQPGNIPTQMTQQRLQPINTTGNLMSPLTATNSNQFKAITTPTSATATKPSNGLIDSTNGNFPYDKTNANKMPPLPNNLTQNPNLNPNQMMGGMPRPYMPPSSASLQQPAPGSGNYQMAPSASGNMPRMMPPTGNMGPMPPSSNSMQMPAATRPATSNAMSPRPMMAPTSTANNVQMPPPVAQQNMAMPPTSSSNMPMQMPPAAAAAVNSYMTPQQPPAAGAPGGPLMQQSRGVYPVGPGPMPPQPQQANLPPMNQQQPSYQQFTQQPPQQHYADVYQQQVRTQQYPPQPQQQQQQQQQAGPAPGMFNGARNYGALQYQNQMPPGPGAGAGVGGAPGLGPAMGGGMPPANTQYPQQASVVQQGFSRLWGQDTIDLMQNRHVMTKATLAPTKVVLQNQFHETINCNPSIMRCTIAKIPENKSLLHKSRLPLGILIHPFRDINSLPVIQCPNIVRCRSCRTYINPFVYFVDSKLWKCNLCYRVNELPDDFQFDPATKTYGDVTRRPEVKSSTIEFIAPSEYMLRPPQPAVYLFLFDVSIIAQQCGYLETVCATMSKHLDEMPGDARTQVGFIAYNSCVHFYAMADNYNQPHEMTLIDIDDVFLPRPDNLLVNLKECKELIKDLLKQLPHRFADTHDPGSALGAALQVAYKLTQASGGRITVFQTCLPNKGPGALEPREDPNNRSAKDVAHLNPATDFYKRYALECSSQQVAVDLFLLNQQYSDMATISGISKHSGGCIYHLPLYQKTKLNDVEWLKQCLKRYLTRKIGFEAVMRIRCTRGLQVHTFHGNFFVRSTDLLSLPNINPDAGYGIQITYEENLGDAKTVCFQAALLYTSSEGERRIRVHTLCLPVTSSLPEVMHAADTEAIIGLLSKMAVERSLISNISDAREAFINATVDILNAFKIAQNLPSGQSGQLIAPRSLALMPLYISALLKHPAFRVGTSTRLDDRVHAMDLLKTLPLDQLMKYVYPELYNVDALMYHAASAANHEDDDDDEIPELPEIPRLQLSAEHLDSRSVFILDCGTLIIVYVGLNVPTHFLEKVFGIKSTAELPDYDYGFPNVNTPENHILRDFIVKLNDDKPLSPTIQIIRDTSTAKPFFIEKLLDDRSQSSLSYYEFLQHVRIQVK